MPTLTLPRVAADYVVVGGGIVGLAVAALLTRAAPAGTTVLVEQHGALLQHTSTRNSGVIHAGLYYPQHSLKAQLCVRGKHLLYSLGDRVATKKVGKLVVARGDAGSATLHALHTRAALLGVPTRLLTPRELEAREPLLAGSGATLGLESPTTGIIDVHSLADYLAAGLTTPPALNTHVKHVSVTNNSYTITTNTCELTTPVLINAAGLWAASLSNSILGADTYRTRFVKGHYFRCTSRIALSSLVYPVPEKLGLGIHATIDMHGNVVFGPDTLDLGPALPARVDYAVDPALSYKFRAAVSEYFPSLADAEFRPDYAGIRPKPHAPATDFVVADEAARGFPGLVSCVGIESPGLTASLAIAERVAGLVGLDRARFVDE